MVLGVIRFHSYRMKGQILMCIKTKPTRVCGVVLTVGTLNYSENCSQITSRIKNLLAFCIYVRSMFSLTAFRSGNWKEFEWNVFLVVS